MYLYSVHLGSPGVSDDEGGVLQFYHSLGLGMLLEQLFAQRFTEITGTQGMVAVWKAVHSLETVVFSDQQYRQVAGVTFITSTTLC